MYFFEEGRLHPQVLGDHIEAEQMSVNAGSSHGHSIEVLVFLRSELEQSPAVSLILADQNKMTSKHVHYSATNAATV